MFFQVLKWILDTFGTEILNPQTIILLFIRVISPMAETQIYIRGFPRQAREDELKKAFIGFGEIKEVKMLGSYAFIVPTYFVPEDAAEAVKSMEGNDFDGEKLKVQIAGKPKKVKGPQADDECRYCGKLGHWKNGCPDFRREKQRSRDKYRRRRRDSRSDSSSSSSESRDRRKKHKKKKKSKKIHKKSRKRSPSSDSYSSSSGSSRSSRSSSQSERDRRSKKKDRKRSTDRK